MFEAGLDQAAGLRAHTLRQGPALLAVASPAQPALAYELLCHLSAQLKAQGRLPVILDGTATETAERPDSHWTYHEETGFTLLPGSPLIDALKILIETISGGGVSYSLPF
mgnify:CR=1 FL=1